VRRVEPDDTLADLERRYAALRKLAESFPAKAARNEQSLADVEKIADPLERARAEGAALQSQINHEQNVATNELMQQVLRLHASVIHLTQRIEAVERRAGSGPGSN
jgi:hypothetical protein